MQRARWLVWSLAGLAIVALPAAAQVKARRDPPLQATAVVTVMRVNAGQRTTRHEHILLARDAAGRTRAVFEPGPDSADGVHPVIVIHDPVAKTIIILYPEQHTAILRAEDREVAGNTPWPAAAVWPSTPVFESVTTIGLGRRTLAGIAAQGQRRSGPLRWQAGTGSIEIWTGDGMNLWTRQSGALGEREFRVTSARLGAPPDALFRLPAGYTVSDRRPTVARRRELIAEARRDAEALDGIGGAYVLAEVAEYEIGADLNGEAAHAQARADALQAMQRLVALQGDDMLRRYKDQTEDRLVLDLTETQFRAPSAADMNTALAMARIADAPRGGLYDWLLTGWFRSDQPPDWNPVALMRECLAADGTFPYNGAQAIITSQMKTGAPTAAQRAVLQLTYATTAAMRDARQVDAAMAFLDNMAEEFSSSPAPWYAAPDWQAQWSRAAAGALRHDTEDSSVAHDIFLRWQKLAPQAASAWLAGHPALSQFTQTGYCRDIDGCGEESSLRPPPPRPTVLTAQSRFMLLQMQARQNCGTAVEFYGLATADPLAAGAWGPEMNLGYALEGCGREDLAEALWGRQLTNDLAVAAKQDARFTAVQGVYASGGVWANVPGGWMLGDFQSDARADFGRTVAAVEQLHARVAQPLILAAIAAGAR